jgi:hypothetical protein
LQQKCSITRFLKIVYPKSEQLPLAEQIGADGLHLLRALEQTGTPAELQPLQSVQLLRQVWQQYYEVREGQARWRAGPQADEDEGVIRVSRHSDFLRI